MTSLRRALLASILTGLLVVLAASGVVVYAVARSSLRAQHDGALVTRARTFAALVLEEAPDPEEPHEPGGLAFDYVAPLGEAVLGVLLRITADDGEIIAQSPEWPLAAAPRTRPSPGGEPVVAGLEIEPGVAARSVVVAAFATRDPDEVAALGGSPVSKHAILVEVIGRAAPLRRAESAVLAAIIVGGLLAAAGTGVAVWLGVRRGLVPIRSLSSALDGLGPARLTMPAAAEPCPEELRPITAAVERLLARLREAIERYRRFTDAAAHELRTPIAELRTIADVADRWPEPERLRVCAAETRSIAGEMERLLENLLTVARGGQISEGQAREPVALLPLARSVARARAAGPSPQPVSWAFEGDENARWNAPRSAVLAIVRNLIDNAAEYTPKGGSVRVAAARNGAGTKLEVENGPVTLAPGDADRIFEPFWRADESRTDRRHRGLGLSIVASLGDGLGLRRSALITADRRLRITISS